MSWTLTNFVIQVLAGLVGGLAAGQMVKEHSVGPRANAALGLGAGVLSGLFLQEVAGTIVTGAGAANPLTGVEAAVLQALSGVASGACLALVVGLAWHMIAEHRAGEKR